MKSRLFNALTASLVVTLYTVACSYVPVVLRHGQHYGSKARKMLGRWVNSARVILRQVIGARSPVRSSTRKAGEWLTRNS